MARPSHGGTTWVPLRENYFATPLLSVKEKSYLVRKSCEAAQEVVERARSSGGPVQWRHVEKFQDVQIYAGQPRGVHGSAAQPADIVSMCGVTSVAASVKEIAALFDLSTTRAMKEFSMENRELFFDAIVLYNLSPRTKERPLHQVTAKWIAVKSPRGIEDRDFCYLECQDKFVDSHGRKGWVLCLHSIKLPGCDDLTREFGFVRGSFYHSGLIVVETDRPGYVDVIHMLQMNFKRNTRVASSFMRDRVAFVAKVRTMMRNKRLNEQRYLSDLELVPKKYRSRCTVCQDSFSLLLLRKMNCRKCGEVVCGACSKEFDVRNAKFLEIVKLRICMHCFQLVTTAPKSQIPMLEQSRASTAMSLLGYYEDDQRASFLTQVPSSAAELAETTGAQRRTKIFLQSLQRQRGSARQSSNHIPAPPMTTEMYYHGAPPPTSVPRGSHPLRPSQLGVHPSRGSVLDQAPPYSRDTISYAAQQQPASIFDRPYTAAPQSAASRDHEYQRQSEYAHHQDVRSRSNTREFPTRGDRVSVRTQNHSYSSAYQYQQHGMSEPPPVAYPDSLRGSESKRRDSESSDSSAGSIDIDADEAQSSASATAYAHDGGDRSRSNSRLSAAPRPLHPPPPYYAVGKDDNSPQRARSPSQPVPYYSESMPPPPSYNPDTFVGSESHDGVSDDELMGSGDEADLSEFTAAHNVASATDESQPSSTGAVASMLISAESQPSSTGAIASSMLSGESHENETKMQEIADTPARSPPSPSAHVAMKAALSEDIAPTVEQSAGTPGERTSEAPEGHSMRESEHAYDLRDSELGLNTTVCDTSFLDSDMRQFHDQSWFINGAQPPLERSPEDASESTAATTTMAVAAARTSDAEQTPFRSREVSTRSSESKAGARSSVSKSQKLHIDAAFAVSRPLLSVNNHVTSPTNSYEGMPSLYAKPRDRKPRVQHTLAHHSQRPGTIALSRMDNDPPPSYASSVSSLKSNDRENVSRQDSSVSSASSTTSSTDKSKKSVTIVDDVNDGDSDSDAHSNAAPQSFFGAVSDDMPALFQAPRSMAAFSATATYEVPQRSKEETQELLRKLSASVLASPGTSDGGKSEPEHESNTSSPSARASDAADRDSEFGAFDGSILHGDASGGAITTATTGAGAGATGAAAPSGVRRFELVPNNVNAGDGYENDNDEEEEEEDALLSARSLYKSFGDTLKITSLVGANDAFKRTFQQIQASIDLLSSDDESDDDDIVDKSFRPRK